jgi:hypothetical protein
VLSQHTVLGAFIGLGVVYCVLLLPLYSLATDESTCDTQRDLATHRRIDRHTDSSIAPPLAPRPSALALAGALASPHAGAQGERRLHVQDQQPRAPQAPGQLRLAAMLQSLCLSADAQKYPTQTDRETEVAPSPDAPDSREPALCKLARAPCCCVWLRASSPPWSQPRRATQRHRETEGHRAFPFRTRCSGMSSIRGPVCIYPGAP